MWTASLTASIQLSRCPWLTVTCAISSTGDMCQRTQQPSGSRCVAHLSYPDTVASIRRQEGRCMLRKVHSPGLCRQEGAGKMQRSASSGITPVSVCSPEVVGHAWCLAWQSDSSWHASGSASGHTLLPPPLRPSLTPITMSVFWRHTSLRSFERC